MKRGKGQWDIGRTFKIDWITKFPFIEPLLIEGEEEPKFATCIPCSWKLGNQVKLQLKLDTIEKHVGKMYEKVEVEGKMENILRWKTKDECRHLQNVDAYNSHLLLLEQSNENKRSFMHLFERKLKSDNEAILMQFSIVLHILSIGKPMSDYPKWRVPLNFIGLRIQSFPTQYWTESSGWEFAKAMGEVIKSNLKISLSNATFISISLDEVTARDCTSWVCIHAYIVENYERKAKFIGAFQLKGSATSNLLVQLVLDSISNIGGMSISDINQKIVCIGVDGCSVMHGLRNGLCVQLQQNYTPYALGIHCMSHRTNLAFKIVSEFVFVQKVEDLVHQAYAFFSKSPKRIKEFKCFSDGISKGRKLKKNIDTRWISLIGPIERLFEEYKSVIGVVNIISLSKGIQKGKAHTLLQMLSDVETLLYLGGMLPLLREMNNLIKVSQSRDIYVMEYAVARKLTCMRLETLYYETSGFDSQEFIEWESLLQVGVEDSFLQYNKKVNQTFFAILVDSVKQGLRSICNKLTSEIRERFPRDELLEAMAIVHPLYWNHAKDKSLLTNDFKSKVQQFDFVKDPSNSGAMTKLWKKLDISPFLKESMSEYFKVANLCLTMILGSVEDERLWSSLTFIRNATRNRLNKNLDTCLRLFVSKSDLETFPFEEAYVIWKSQCQRRSECVVSSERKHMEDVEPSNIFQMD
ncbi:hypothetical protein KP509_09G016700 [Ceratopteris richardii]|uniref:DUF4371 domain-containing protein n=1 Tax=Ceratopteris richardii TaxID=49495 RepID=A0A8T2TYC1_CERRI|nr:hypothetical protein KP509_09G016700 [Ceratopteris richardii]